MFLGWFLVSYVCWVFQFRCSFCMCISGYNSFLGITSFGISWMHDLGSNLFSSLSRSIFSFQFSLSSVVTIFIRSIISWSSLSSCMSLSFDFYPYFRTCFLEVCVGCNSIYIATILGCVIDVSGCSCRLFFRCFLLKFVIPFYVEYISSWFS